MVTLGSTPKSTQRWDDTERQDTGSNPVLTTKIKKIMEEIIETVIHDFLTDPLYYITIALCWILLGVLIVGVIF